MLCSYQLLANRDKFRLKVTALNGALSAARASDIRHDISGACFIYIQWDILLRFRDEAIERRYVPKNKRLHLNSLHTGHKYTVLNALVLFAATM